MVTQLELERGVRQSCPVAGVLVVIADYILANLIRNDHIITDIHFQGA